MLIQCSICKKIRKFGKWIDGSAVLLTDSNIPVKYMLCDDCKGTNGGCERLRILEEKAKRLFWYLTISLAGCACGALFWAVVYWRFL
jgi:hypothetical protein